MTNDVLPHNVLFVKKIGVEGTMSERVCVGIRMSACVSACMRARARVDAFFRAGRVDSFGFRFTSRHWLSYKMRFLDFCICVHQFVLGECNIYSNVLSVAILAQIYASAHSACIFAAICFCGRNESSQ